MIRALVVDDEPIARAGIVKLLEGEPDVTVIGECRDGAEAVEDIRVHQPDLVFLDVQMPELTGFEVLASLQPHELPATIFVTAYDEYALDAFEASAVDYLLKPFDRERFARALSRARRLLAGDQLAAFRAKVASVLHMMGPGARSAGAGAEPLNGSAGSASSGPNAASNRHAERARGGDSRLVIRTRGRITFVAVGEIEWIETSRNYVRVRAKGVWHTMREPLATFASRLDPLQFVQVSRSCIVNLDRVREFRRQANGQYTVLLDDGQRLVASRRYGAKLAPSGEDTGGDDA
jgi:two-component system, LytTR family, response regulator